VPPVQHTDALKCALSPQTDKSERIFQFVSELKKKNIHRINHNHRTHFCLQPLNIVRVLYMFTASLLPFQQHPATCLLFKTPLQRCNLCRVAHVSRVSKISERRKPHTATIDSSRVTASSNLTLRFSSAFSCLLIESGYFTFQTMHHILVLLLHTQRPQSCIRVGPLHDSYTITTHPHFLLPTVMLSRLSSQVS